MLDWNILSELILLRFKKMESEDIPMSEESNSSSYKAQEPNPSLG